MPLDVDGLGRIESRGCPTPSTACARAGRRPMALVANACSTGTGLYDDLRGIGGFCARQRRLVPRGRRPRRLGAAVGGAPAPARRDRAADSLIWDAHKMLRTSSLVAAVLTRREARPGRGLPAAGELPVLRRPGLRPDRQDRGVHQGRAGPEALPQPGLAGRAGPGRLRRAAVRHRAPLLGAGSPSGRVSNARTSRRATSSASGTAPATRPGSASA